MCIRDRWSARAAPRPRRSGDRHGKDPMLMCGGGNRLLALGGAHRHQVRHNVEGEGDTEVHAPWTPGVDSANPRPRATSPRVVYGSYQVVEVGGRPAHGRAAAALMAMTPTSCSTAWASRASASRR